MSRWNITADDGAICWDIADAHTDDVEMSGFLVSDIVTYGAAGDGLLVLEHHPVFPSLRRRPNDTHASYQLDVNTAGYPKLTYNGAAVVEKPLRAVYDGILTVISASPGLKITRRVFPSINHAATYELVTATNSSAASAVLSTGTAPLEPLDEELGCMCRIICERSHTFVSPVSLEPGENVTFSIIITARAADKKRDFAHASEELHQREAQVARLTSPLTLDTGNPVLDTMFHFAKLRAGDSVFKTRAGLIHSPGGRSYYGATWCNDQVEYSGPWFGLTGDPILLEASANAYRMYMPFMSDKFSPIPSSIIAEGVDFWNGAGDRGDAAMYLYGGSSFALSCGDNFLVRDLLPALEWCAEYCRRKLNADGVITSDSDELEGRFPAGKANLSTSSLAYGGYIALSSLEDKFGTSEKACEYRAAAVNLADAIERYFGQALHGFDTYRYYDGCEVLRSWICLPLCVGIFDRAEGTADALLSPYLLKGDGLLTTEENSTVWDRSTLYALRGIFASGKRTDDAFGVFLRYSENRLLGERVPYAVEAYPEGGRRHLSAESALYCKIITDGLLRMRLTGPGKLSVNPLLPECLNHINLTNIKFAGHDIDIYASRSGVRVVCDGVRSESPYGEAVCIC